MPVASPVELCRFAVGLLFLNASHVHYWHSATTLAAFICLCAILCLLCVMGADVRRRGDCAGCITRTYARPAIPRGWLKRHCCCSPHAPTPL